MPSYKTQPLISRMVECFVAIVIDDANLSVLTSDPSLRLPISFGNRLRSYSDPLPLDLDPLLENEKQFHSAQDLSSALLRQATSNCVEYQARRGGGTIIPYRDNLLGHSLASP